MANFKNKRRRASRAGCHMCKPHKVMGNSKDATKAKYHEQKLS